MSILSKTFIFVAGAAVGSVVTGVLLKRKYEQWLDEEIAAIEYEYSNRQSHEGDTEPDPETVLDIEDAVEINPTVEELKNYHELIGRTKYDTGGITAGEPRVVSFDEYYACQYEPLALNYYLDGVLTYEHDDTIVEDAGEIIGDAVDHFNECEEDDDAVYVINDEEEIKFEILRDYRNYADVFTADGPPDAEEE